MLTSIQLRELDNTTLLSLPFGAPNSSGFFLKEVEGLGAIQADIVTSQFASYDGGLYQSSRVGTRNIVLTVGMAPRFDVGNDISTLRDTLYGNFAPRSPVNLIFISDYFAGGNAATRRISGYVESVEPVMFSSKPEVQISIICPRPYFQNYSTFSIDGQTGVPLDTSLFGTAPAGFVFDITLLNDASRITLETEFDEPLVFNSPLKTGDRLRISTLSGNKYVLVTKSGQSSSISLLDGIESGSMSLSLDRRTKSFIVNRTSGAGSPYKVSYIPEYVGL